MKPHFEDNGNFVGEVHISNTHIKDTLKNNDYNNYILDLTKTLYADIRDNWERFEIDNLYELYEKLGFTDVLLISKKDYKDFLFWALPKYKKHLKGNK